MRGQRKVRRNKVEVDRLLELAASGDPEAFSTLVRMYEPMLKKALKSYDTEGMSREDIEDLRQEQLVAFYRAIISFRREQEDVEFGLYARICVVNSMASYKRAMVKRSREELIDEETMNNISDPTAEPPRIVEMRESEEELDRQIERTLSPYENEVWTHHLNGCSTHDIAQMLSSSEKSVDNALFRIRKKLRAHFRAD